MFNLRKMSVFTLSVFTFGSGCVTSVGNQPIAFSNCRVSSSDSSQPLVENTENEKANAVASTFHAGWTMESPQEAQAETVQRFPNLKARRAATVRTADQKTKNLFE